MADNSSISNSNRRVMTKKTLFRILLGTLLLVVLIDLCTGWVMGAYVRHCDIPGDYGKIEYMMKRADAQIILLGASTCMNSIDPEVLEEGLGKRVFNGGLNDQRLEFFDVMTDAIFRHSKPEMLVLVLRPNDLITDKVGRLPMMNIYYHLGNAKLDEYLNENSFKQKLLLFSSLYRYNTYWWRLLLYHFKPTDELAHGGFLAKPIPKLPPQRWDSSVSDGGDKPAQVNPRKLRCLENILATCREAGARLWIVITPEFISPAPEGYHKPSPIREFCTENNIPLIDDSRSPDFIDHAEYFFDNYHLNGKGAVLYSQHFLELLKKEYE